MVFVNVASSVYKRDNYICVEFAGGCKSPMIPGFIIFLIFFVILYTSTHENRQLTATASALREIWSGGCRLSCQRSECSGLSGLSGRASPAHAAPRPPPHAPHAPHAHNCVCDYCPCAVIEAVLRSCRPATSAYSNTLEVIAEFFYSMLKVMSDLYLLVKSAALCRVSCQRQAQLVDCSDSEENFNFGDTQPSDSQMTKDKPTLKEKTMEKIKKTLSTISRNELNLSKLALVKKRSTTSVASAKASKSNIKAEKEPKITKKTSKLLKTKASGESADTSAATSSTSSCPRCVEKGKVCMRGCPKATAVKK